MTVQADILTENAPDMRRIERRRALFWLLPPILWFVGFMLVPYAITLFYSFGRMDYVQFVAGFSLDNYVKVLTVQPYAGLILRSAKIGLLTAFWSTLLAYPVAIAMAFYLSSECAKHILYILVILPWWASYLVKAYAWKTILGTHGLLNEGLIWLGVIDEPLTVFLYNDFSIILTLTYIFTPFAVLSIYAQLERLPLSLIEAARDLGATGWETFIKVIWPISIPGVLAGGVITFSLGFGDFIAPALLGGADSIMISSVVISLLGVANDRPLAAAIGVAIILMAMALLTVSQYLEKRTQVRL
ncbi:spermidine/putrescine transport system permease protein [Dongia mobilis]|uniref:Spermidine/putrescine transport system permease protein n=1 Tax=Dongia mobilis TaxID=578943 RepID=A0A4R6WF24_9PROT|nr:ABC transporter permease [Dongia mobilis]TDQ78426.1 spermidine/putrescine transport system permease protein [Dongia mobilis]